MVVDGGFEEVGVCFEPGLVEVSEEFCLGSGSGWMYHLLMFRGSVRGGPAERSILEA